MDIPLAVITVIGLAAFEMITSVDNAVVNADVLSTMTHWARRWFLVWGMLVSVFLVRLSLPFLIVYSIAGRAINSNNIFIAIISGDPSFAQAVSASAPPLLSAGGMFLAFLFLHWLFLEPKNYGLRGEEYIYRRGAWFYAVASVILTLTIWYSIEINNSWIAFGAAIGSSLFFITHGFRQNAEEREKQMSTDQKMSEWSKLLYLEVIDASFSIDGVLGAFAFTLSVPLIVIGTAIGAVGVRQLTVRNIENVKKYKYLKNGAMYSIACLGSLMLADAFGSNIPQWVSPLATAAIMSYFFFMSWKSVRETNSN